MQCSKCGNPNIKVGQKFCTKCGQPVSQNEPQGPAPEGPNAGNKGFIDNITHLGTFIQRGSRGVQSEIRREEEQRLRQQAEQLGLEVNKPPRNQQGNTPSANTSQNQFQPQTRRLTVDSDSVAGVDIVQGRAIWNINKGEIGRLITETEFANAEGLKGVIVQEGCTAFIFIDGQLISMMQAGIYTFPAKTEAEKQLEIRKKELEAEQKAIANRERQLNEEAARQVEQNNLTNLSNLSMGSQVNFAIPSFDVFDPRLKNTGVPVSVHGSIVYAIEDLDLFHNINKREAYSDETFQNKLRGTVTKFVKGVVTNAPIDAQIPVVQIERKVMEISNLVESYVVPKVENIFGVKVRSLDITNLIIDKNSRGFRELNALTADLEKDDILAQHKAKHSVFSTQSALNVDALKRQHEMNMGGQEEMQRMSLEQQRMNLDQQRINLDHQRETMRIQRDEMQRASKLQTEQTFLGAHQANLNAGIVNNALDSGFNTFESKSAMGAPSMPGASMGIPSMGAPSMPAEPNVQYMVGVNGQQAGPFNWQQLKQLVQQGQLTAQAYVWKQGMPQWAMAGQVAELQPLFANAMPVMPGMPPQMPGF